VEDGAVAVNDPDHPDVVEGDDPAHRRRDAIEHVLQLDRLRRDLGDLGEHRRDRLGVDRLEPAGDQRHVFHSWISGWKGAAVRFSMLHMAVAIGTNFSGAREAAATARGGARNRLRYSALITPHQASLEAARAAWPMAQ
jgi:hypothetical protein